MCLGVPGRIVSLVDDAQRLAVVDVAGVRRTVNIAFIVDAEHPPSACLNTWVLVHVGFAMSRIDEAEAARTLELLEELGELQAEIEAAQRSSQAGEAPPSGGTGL